MDDNFIASYFNVKQFVVLFLFRITNNIDSESQGIERF